MKKKQNKTLKKLYAYKEWLEGKIQQYRNEIISLQDERTDILVHSFGKSRELYEDSCQCIDREIDDWQKLINEAEAALVFIKTSIAFEED